MVDSEAERSTSASSDTLDDAQVDESAQQKSDAIALPAHVAGSGKLDRLVDQAHDYAATAENTKMASCADWTHFTSWCRRKGVYPLVPSPAVVGLYIADCAKPADGRPALSVSTIERRSAGLASSAEVDGRYVQKQLGHASAEMTRRYQRRRDRFRVNLTKASYPLAALTFDLMGFPRFMGISATVPSGISATSRSRPPMPST